MLPCEDDLLLVAEVPKKGRPADFGPLGDVGYRDAVETVLREQLRRCAHDALSSRLLLALDEGKGRRHTLILSHQVHYEALFPTVLRSVWYYVPY